ncbi:tripartite tricarboxylate transporter TctB family protein [Chloroflexi bacterium TSY]|nr:tripartite tricarboxylate transporter TctB family protein [Chloroflexi bacterium TSY]
MQNEAPSARPGIGIIYGVLLFCGVGFLLLLPVATKAGPKNQGWWTQPAFMPGLSLLVVTISAGYLVIHHIRSKRRTLNRPHQSSRLSAELLQWLKPLEFFVYYIGYIWLLGQIGYFLSSLIFIVMLCIRVGLRSTKWMLTALLFAIALIALFRWGLGVWVPPAELYQLFPREMRIFLMNNF